MRSTVKVLSAVAVLAMAAGLSACDEQDAAQPSGGDASASASAEADSDSSSSESSSSDSTPSEDSKDDKDSKSQDGETTKSGSKIQEIKPVTFKDESIGLTQTCDKVVEDYAAPKYKKTHSDQTVYLLHCTLDFSGDIGYSSTLSDSISFQDKSNSSLKANEYGALLSDDLKDDGLETIDYDDFGTDKVDGWFGLASVSESSKLKPFSDGTTSIVYSRDDGESKDTGKQYPAYSDTQDLVLK